MTKRSLHLHKSVISVTFALLVTTLFGLVGCGSSNDSGVVISHDLGETTGAAFSPPTTILMSPYSRANAIGTDEANIDISSASEGYVAASAVSPSRLKLQVKMGDLAYNYDMPTDGTPIVAPLNMGDGTYQISIMQNTTENRYIALLTTTVDVTLASETIPFLRPNIFCDYTADDPVVQKAHELVADAKNDGDALRAIYGWIIENIKYDTAKAADLAGKTGYIPDPTETLESKTGICFDYASLAAAMLRSQGIPCKVITGYVSPNGIYHAWNMVWIDGSWKTVSISIDPRTWSRLDTTFAAGGDTSTVGDGSRYEDRFVY